MALYHTFQKNVIIGQRNTLRVLISLITAVDEDLVERIIDKLEDMSIEEYQKIAEVHAPVLKMAPSTVVRHMEKIRDGKMDEIVWPEPVEEE